MPINASCYDLQENHFANIELNNMAVTNTYRDLMILNLAPKLIARKSNQNKLVQTRQSILNSQSVVERRTWTKSNVGTLEPEWILCLTLLIQFFLLQVILKAATFM